MIKKEIFSALIGLVGAVENSGKSNCTDTVIINALQNESITDAVSDIHKEKFKISPGCTSCKMKCGKTSDYDIEKFDSAPEEIKNLKEKTAKAIIDFVNNTSGELPVIIYKAIAYLGYDLTPNSYEQILEDLSNDKKDNQN